MADNAKLPESILPVLEISLICKVRVHDLSESLVVSVKYQLSSEDRVVQVVVLPCIAVPEGVSSNAP